MLLQVQVELVLEKEAKNKHSQLEKLSMIFLVVKGE